ncbi:alpha/beta hydrolase [Roseateles sp. DAIF2]|uniref:alpha/beta hydrolase n=1 Tax=Roseateles sp. DAIF2 TaxID=2714952 RepID=UPI0018A33025|nr:alpha/beta hydrolase [Roseateles sp. DAIF2]QPF75372.1 alpha/beta hydrolase [Roseateles sp. DAIF2]
MGEYAGRGWGALTGGHAGARWFWHRQLKKPFFGRFMKPWRWPGAVDAALWLRVQIASGSQARLAAVLRETRLLPARGVVVCAHPMGLASKGFWLRNGHAARLLEAGFHVLAFDFNGFGESESTNFDWPADVVAVGQWARQRYPGLPVHALTASFGAMNIINAMPRADFPFERIVAEGCAPNLPMFWKAYPFAHAVLQLGRHLAPTAERRLRPELAIRQMPAGSRLLLIHSRGDRWTPVAHGDRLAAAAPAGAAVMRLTLERADHTHGLRDEPEAWWPAVRDFLFSA